MNEKQHDFFFTDSLVKLTSTTLNNWEKHVPLYFIASYFEKAEY